MNNIISYNEAIRWYKNGKLELYKDIEEPIVEKDLFVFNYGSGNYIAYYNGDELFYDNFHYMENVLIFDRPKSNGLNIRINIPTKVKDDLFISYFIQTYKGEDHIDCYYTDLPIEIKERIINI